MIEVTADRVAQLRAATGAPLMKCKKALVEAEGDMERALPILHRISGVAVSRRDSSETEGYVAVYSHQNNQVVALVELACDTDFVFARWRVGEMLTAAG